MKEWQEVSLGSVANIISQKTAITNATLDNYISTDNMLPCFGGVRKAEKLPNLSTINGFSAGDILFSNIRTYFKKVWYSTFDGTVSADVLVFRTISSSVIDNMFLYFLLCSPEFTEFTVLTSRGAKMPRGDKEAIKSYNFMLPSLPEQKAIAGVLSSLDDKIDLLNRQNKTLETMAETLFRQWFIEEAEDDWKIVKLKSFISTNIRTISKNSELSQIKYLDTGSITEGIISELQVLKFKDAPSRARRLVKHNDILFSTVRPNQKHYGLVRNPENELVVSTGFAVLTCETINPYFVYLFLTTTEMTEFLHSIAEGSTSAYPSLKPSDLENIEFQLPSSHKLESFGKDCEAIWDKIEYNQKQADILSITREILLPKLMSGEVKVQI